MTYAKHLDETCSSQRAALLGGIHVGVSGTGVLMLEGPHRADSESI